MSEPSVGLIPATEIPEAPELPDGLADNAVLSPDGSATLVTHHVRTRRFDRTSGEPTVVLEGWWQVEGAWFSNGGYGILCTKGQVSLDRSDPEVASLKSLDALPKNQTVVEVISSGLVHLFDHDNNYLGHLEIDGQRIQSSRDGCIVVVTRPPRSSKQWATVVLGVTEGGLVPLGKFTEDIGALRCDGDRLFGDGGYEIVGARAALEASASWGLESVSDGLALEPPPPPPPQTLPVEHAPALVLELAEDATKPERPAEDLDDAEVAELVGWPSVLSRHRSPEVIWCLTRLFKAHCELLRFRKAEEEWRCVNRLPVEGFDRVRIGHGGRLAIVTIDNAPKEMAWSMLLGLDSQGDLRKLGRLNHVVSDSWDDDGSTFIELLGGAVYRLSGFDQAIADSVAAEPRPPLALVFDVDGHYGKREFLAKYEHDFGYLDESGQVVIAHQYTTAYDFENDYRARVAHCGSRLFGLIDRFGELVVPHRYSWIGEVRDDCRTVARGEPNILGKLPETAEWGLLDDEGEVVLEPTAQRVRDMSEGRAAVQRDGTWNLVNQDGHFLLEKEGNKCGNFYGGLCPVAIDDLWGFVNHEGTWVVDPTYEGAGEFRDGVAGVKLPGAAGWSFINNVGTIVSDREYDGFYWHAGGYGRVRVGDKWGFVDNQGRLAIPAEYDEVFNFRCGVASVRVGDEWFWINETGAPITDERFAKCFDFKDDIGVFEDGAYRGYMRADGSVVARGFEGAHNFSEGLAAVQVRARWGYINPDGEVVAKHRYAAAHPFSEGLAAVRTVGKWAFIDPSGRFVVPPKLGTPGSFRQSRAHVHR